MECQSIKNRVVSELSLEDQAGTGEAGLGFLELGDVERRDVEAAGFDTGASAGEGRGEDDRAPYGKGVCGVLFGGVDVDPAELHAANALALANSVIFPASFPRTRARIEARGFHVTPLDISELQKAESGLTCSSLIFRA